MPSVWAPATNLEGRLDVVTIAQIIVRIRFGLSPCCCLRRQYGSRLIGDMLAKHLRIVVKKSIDGRSRGIVVRLPFSSYHKDGNAVRVECITSGYIRTQWLYRIFWYRTDIVSAQWGSEGISWESTDQMATVT